MDFEKARYNMVEQQVRPWDVLDPRVIEAMNTIPREHFAPEAYKSLSYADTRIPLGKFEDSPSVMLNPVIEGRMLQVLTIGEDDVVLEIGTGSGYLTACIAKLARHVDSVDINPEMTAMAEKNLNDMGINNFLLRTGDASNGWYECKPRYDAIVLTGSMPSIPECYKKSLKIGGRLLVVTGDAPVMTAQLITRISEKEWNTESIFETCIDRLINAEAPKTFTF